MDSRPLFVFPKWSNGLTLSILAVLLVAPLYLGALVAYGIDPVTLNVGYQPIQPVPYSHALHVGQLGMDCLYCHNTVDKSGFAAIPPTDTCMNCHTTIWNNQDPAKKSQKLLPLFDSAKTGLPVKWVKIHDLPDYVFFNHSAHVNQGVSCVECHGQVNHMDVVRQVQPLNMAWCLECHRDVAPRLRPKDQVTNLDWKPSADDPSTVKVFAALREEDLRERASRAGVQAGSGTSKEQLARQYVGVLAQRGEAPLRRELGEVLKSKDFYNVNPSTDCVTCHR